MKYCSMTTMFYSQPGCKEKISVEESLQRIAQLGIKYIDLNMCAVGRFGEHQFDRDDWESQAYRIKELADKLELRIVQTHLPYQGKLHKFDFYDCDSYKHMQACILRAMKISNIVGADWAVLHPVRNPDYSNDEVDKQIEENHLFYKDVINESCKGVCGLAFENMIHENFCTIVDDLISLVDSFKSPKIQAAWDFGHANLIYGDNQDKAIIKLGNRLKAVHVADNYGVNDDHLAPYQGSINWDRILSTLKDIHFDGYWDFEIGKSYSNLPLELKNEAMIFYKDIADYMIERYESIKKGI